MRDENNFHSQRELTQSLLPFFSGVGKFPEKLLLCSKLLKCPTAVGKLSVTAFFSWGPAVSCRK